MAGQNTYPNLQHLAQPGAEITVRVTPNAARNRIVQDKDQLHIYVTVVPENGKATAAVIKLLSKALDHPKSRITLLRGATSSSKVFKLE